MRGRREHIMGWFAAATLALLTATPLSGQSDARDDCPRGDSASAGLQGTIDANASMTLATTDARSAGAEIGMVNEAHPTACGWRRQRTRIEVTGKYDEKQKGSASKIITRNHTGRFQHLVYLPGNRAFLSGNAEFLHNNSLAVYLQQIYSVQVGRRFATGPASLTLSAGPAYVGQNFLGDDPSSGFAALRAVATGGVSFPVGSRQATLNLTTRTAAPLTDDGAWLASSHASLVLPITKRVDVVLSAFDEYVENAPESTENHYFTSSVGISVKIGPI